MRKEVYNQRTIEGKTVEINNTEMRVRRVNFYAKSKERSRELVEVEVYDFNDNYSVFMYLPDWNHLCKCHWVNVEEI